MPEAPIDFRQFEDVTYESFRRRAVDPTLSIHEKVGFPDAYRAGKYALILEDISSKLTHLNSRHQIVVDLGPGCGELAKLLMERCAEQSHHLFQVDSAEMLSLLPEVAGVTRVPGCFPRDTADLVDALRGRVHCVLAYSVLSCVFAEANVFEFIDRAVELLTEGGQLLLGDVPNVSKRKRFFASDAGVRYHQKFMATSDRPEVAFNVLEPVTLDDAVILAILGRYRSAGCDTFVLPQQPALPFANRREDILISRL